MNSEHKYFSYTTNINIQFYMNRFYLLIRITIHINSECSLIIHLQAVHTFTKLKHLGCGDSEMIHSLFHILNSSSYTTKNESVSKCDRWNFLELKIYIISMENFNQLNILNNQGFLRAKVNMNIILLSICFWMVVIIRHEQHEHVHRINYIHVYII